MILEIVDETDFHWIAQHPRSSTVRKVIDKLKDDIKQSNEIWHNYDTDIAQV